MDDSIDTGTGCLAAIFLIGVFAVILYLGGERIGGIMCEIMGYQDYQTCMAAERPDLQPAEWSTAGKSLFVICESRGEVRRYYLVNEAEDEWSNGQFTIFGRRNFALSQCRFTWE